MGVCCREHMLIIPKLLLFFSAVTEIGHVYAWGDNDHGQQGNGTTMVNRKPALVHGLEGYKVCLQLLTEN